MNAQSMTQKKAGYQVAALPDLPYAEDALEPYLSAETLKYHYGKHHKKYVDTLNNLVQDTEYEDMRLDDIIRTANGAIFNNAAQVWNHTFYWHGFAPKASGKPGDEVDAKLTDAFGSFDAFKEHFNTECKGLFGSGWVWLVMNDQGKLSIEVGKDADNPLRSGRTPLLTCDMWEHAYYIDYRNDKQKYLDAFWRLVDWEVIGRRLSGKAPV